jgi:hypothetical protein
MNRKLLVGLLLIAIGCTCAIAAAADDPQTAAGERKPEMSGEATLLPLDPNFASLFGPQPTKFNDVPYDAAEQLKIYGSKHLNPTKHPIVDVGLKLYERGSYDPRPTWLGAKDPIMSAFMAYGDVRVAAASYDNGGGDKQVIAARLNLDMDLALTATERLHAFVRPLDKGGSFTRYQFGGSGAQDKFVHEFNFDLKTLFFEGDIGAIRQGWSGKTNRYDVPFAIGRVPLFTQNGIWIDDAFDGAAVSVISAKNSPTLDISNMDLTLFAGFNDVTSPAIPATTKANVFGMAGFADLLEGYAEWGYGYVDNDNNDLSYHNLTAAFTKRYKGRVSNSVRLIGNVGQKGILGQAKTADGLLILVENSFIRREFLAPTFWVPYANFFAGFNSPQSLARAADAGGVLKNTGINFETDGLTNYPTLDATAHDSYGAAFGVEKLFQKLDGQIVVEGAIVERRGDNTQGNQYALGARYQHRISNAWIVRLDAMKGWRQGLKDVYGARVEIRRKF